MLKANEELVEYWHPTKGGWYLGVVESVDVKRKEPSYRIRPLKQCAWVKRLIVPTSDTRVVRSFLSEKDLEGLQ